MESGGGSWPDDVKKISLDRILSDELVRAMITVPSQPDFEFYYSILKETDNRLRAYKSRASKSKDSTSFGTSYYTWRSPIDKNRIQPNTRPSKELKLDREILIESME